MAALDIKAILSHADVGHATSELLRYLRRDVRCEMAGVVGDGDAAAVELTVGGSQAQGWLQFDAKGERVCDDTTSACS